MKRGKLLALVLMACGTGVMCAETFIPANHKGIVYSGRVNFSNPASPLMVYPGTMFSANFTGTSIAMKAKPGSGYFMVTVDKMPAYKIFFTEKDSVISLAKDLKGDEHSVTVMLSYEGYNARPEFRGFLVDDGCSLKGAPKLPSRKIEFIGNSITCGYGTEAKNEFENYSDSTENHYYTYAAITSRALQCQHMVVARSGIGMYRNYGEAKTGSVDNMTKWYDYTSLYDDSQKWEHSKYHADVICINLGTNDFSTGNYDAELYRKNYEMFVKHLRTLHPNSKIVMLTGPMLTGKENEAHKAAVDAAYKNLIGAGVLGIFRFDFSTQTGKLGYGASWHPSKAQHVKMANELVPFLKKITGWK